jgi:hypothetical protein
MAAPLVTRPAPRRTSAADRRDAQLALLPGRRRVAWFAVGLVVLVGAVMAGAVLLHTTLAARQLEIDELERGVRTEQEQFDVLRAQRAELRSPTRLAGAAAELGMTPGLETEYLAVDPMVLAVTIARTGEMPVGEGTEVGGNARLRPLDQFRLVKSVGAEAP